jgi:hypothetical protein
VVAVSEEVMVPPKTLPPQGLPTNKPKLKIGDTVFVMKFSYKYPWKTGQITAIIPKERGV